MSRGAVAARYLHWNLRGRGFLSLHEHLDELAVSLWEQADEVAERLVALGTPIQTSGLQPSFPKQMDDFVGIESTIYIMSQILSDAVELIRDYLSAYEDEYPVKTDVLVETMGGLQKQIWLLRSEK